MRPSVLFVLGTGHALTDSSQSSRASSSHSGLSQLHSLWQYHLGPHPHLHLHSRSPRYFVEVCDGSQGKTIFLPKGHRVRRSHCQNREHPDPRSQRTGVAKRQNLRLSPDPPYASPHRPTSLRPTWPSPWLRTTSSAATCLPFSIMSSVIVRSRPSLALGRSERA